jgi:endonuclease YncB( thermonuclease family)
MKNLIILFSALFLFTTDCSPERPKIKNNAILSGLCIGVSDGDTFTILTEKKKEYKIRLLHVDCPEEGQPFGKNAKQFTSDFCFRGQVKIHYNPQKSTDRTGWVLGVVFNGSLPFRRKRRKGSGSRSQSGAVGWYKSADPA